MDDKRRYQRYAVNDRNAFDFCKITVEDELVKLVDFSVVGLCVLSKKPFSPGIKSVLVELRDSGKVELIGAIVRVEKKGFKWHIAIDLTETYKLKTLQKV
jgi:hypothetical protein